MAESSSSAPTRVRSFGLNNSILQTEDHQFVNFSPAMQRRMATAATGVTPKPREPSPPAPSPSLPPAKEPKKRKKVESSDEEEEEEWDSEDLEYDWAQNVYGGFLGKRGKGTKKGPPKFKTAEEEKDRKKKAKRRKKGGEKTEGGKPKGPRSVGKQKEARGKGGVTITKGKSLDGVTQHLMVKQNRTKYGMFGKPKKANNLENKAGSSKKKAILIDDSEDDDEAEERMIDDQEETLAGKNDDIKNMGRENSVEHWLGGIETPVEKENLPKEENTVKKGNPPDKDSTVEDTVEDQSEGKKQPTAEVPNARRVLEGSIKQKSKPAITNDKADIILSKEEQQRVGSKSPIVFIQRGEVLESNNS